MKNYFANTIDKLHDLVDKDVSTKDCRIIYGTVESANPLRIRMDTGVTLGSRKFKLSEFVAPKKVKFPATFDCAFSNTQHDGVLSGVISGNVTVIAGEPMGAQGAISGHISIHGTMTGTMTGVAEGTIDSDTLWGGLQQGDIVMMTRHNNNQQYLIHCVTNRDLM